MGRLAMSPELWPSPAPAWWSIASTSRPIALRLTSLKASPPTWAAGGGRRGVGSTSTPALNGTMRFTAAPSLPPESETVAGERPLLVVVSTPGGLSPSQRYRFEQWAPHLAADHGIALDFAPFES